MLLFSVVVVAKVTDLKSSGETSGTSELEVILDAKIFAETDTSARNIALMKAAKSEVSFDETTVKVGVAPIPLA